ncbi:unnamed protein product, partial [Lymnaea stagnalis]
PNAHHEHCNTVYIPPPPPTFLLRGNLSRHPVTSTHGSRDCDKQSNMWSNNKDMFFPFILIWGAFLVSEMNKSLSYTTEPAWREAMRSVWDIANLRAVCVHSYQMELDLIHHPPPPAPPSLTSTNLVLTSVNIFCY